MNSPTPISQYARLEEIRSMVPLVGKDCAIPTFVGLANPSHAQPAETVFSLDCGDLDSLIESASAKFTSSASKRHIPQISRWHVR